MGRVKLKRAKGQAVGHLVPGGPVVLMVVAIDMGGWAELMSEETEAQEASETEQVRDRVGPST